ncbi:cupin domain-containing protein [Candidatus Aerophobetes bacterium]|nr:cupin domain-containing protein [Candidatus Aerophobetes bacterium]
MYIINIKDCEEKAVKSERTLNTTLRWLLSSEHGVPNFEMRCFDIKKEGRTRYGSHPHEHEVLVLEGKGVLNINGEKKKIKPYDAIYIAPDEYHQFINEGEDTLRIICLIPKGKEDHHK